MSLAGLRGADHAFYYERARVLLPFRTGARTYLGEDRVPLLMPEPPRARFQAAVSLASLVARSAPRLFCRIGG